MRFLEENKRFINFFVSFYECCAHCFVNKKLRRFFLFFIYLVTLAIILRNVFDAMLCNHFLIKSKEISVIEDFNYKMEPKVRDIIEEKKREQKIEERTKKMKVCWEKIEKNAIKHKWQLYDKIRITPNGALSAAIFRGADEVNKFLEAKGKYNPEDENGDKLSKFFSINAGYENFKITGVKYSYELSDAYRIINLHKKTNKIAENILYNHVLKENKDNKVILEDLEEFGRERTYAVFCDLDGDGRDEVLGYLAYMPFSAKFMSEFYLFILQKQKDGTYKEIGSPLIAINYLYILNTKTEGYRDIFYYDSGRTSTGQYNLKFHGNVYSYDSDIYLTTDHIEKCRKLWFYL